MRLVGATPPAPRASPGKAGRGAAPSGPYSLDALGLTSYGTPPNVEVSVREFEEFARDRLRVLHMFDRLCSYETRLDGIGELRSKVVKEMSSMQLVLDYPSGLNEGTFEARKAEFVRRDSVSHFALRLAFCKTREARDWFVRQEQRLFVMRFESLRPEAQELFIERSGLKCRRVDVSRDAGSESGVNLADIQKATPAAKIFRDGGRPEWDNNFYLMPFYEVDPKLIASRRIVIVGGNAYVPSVALKLILAKKFKDELAGSLDVAFQGLPTALADPRIGGFLRDLQEYGMHLLVAPKASTSVEDIGETLTLANFEEVLVRSFPPCMRRLVERQREMKKHLKHSGRLQLRPFLKDCGFTMEESYKWWKQELCRDPAIDAASFEKNYTYDVEHTYGKKGHLQGQNCFGCAKIIGFPAESAGQVHGCPFKTLEMPALKQQMHKWKVPERNVLEMQKLISQGNHYQLACIEYFKAMHEDNEGNRVGNSPGDFFRDSSLWHKQKHEKEAAAAGNGSPAKAA